MASDPEVASEKLFHLTQAFIPSRTRAFSLDELKKDPCVTGVVEGRSGCRLKYEGGEGCTLVQSPAEGHIIPEFDESQEKGLCHGKKMVVIQLC